MDNSVNIVQRQSKSSVLIFAMVIEGTVSQILYSGPSSHFMCFRKLYSQLFLKRFPIFDINLKTKA